MSGCISDTVVDFPSADEGSGSSFLVADSRVEGEEGEEGEEGTEDAAGNAGEEGDEGVEGEEGEGHCCDRSTEDGDGGCPIPFHPIPSLSLLRGTSRRR